ncbi:formate dehydrogenase accessory sulfurtransferase FdhD [Candidatus Bathyarchaeota archaeon]|nr:formate dehydrogenase accessory sulfurtransferase FdhD [Candidatus Bathyarchaeota archaeon]
MRDSTSKVKVVRINVREGKHLEVEDLVAVEAPISLYINGIRWANLMATPTMLKELTLGYALSEGLLRNLSELRSVRVEDNAVKLEAKINIDLNRRLQRVWNSDCVGILSTLRNSMDKGSEILDRLKVPLVSSGYAVKGSELLKMASELNLRSDTFKATGGVHSAALFQRGHLVAFAEDVGRHNAIDKVLGAGALSNVDFQNTVLISSGRLGGEMVIKAARLGIPIVASISAPLLSGIMVAEKAGITLLGFVRGLRLNVYSHPGRILLD